MSFKKLLAEQLHVTEDIYQPTKAQTKVRKELESRGFKVVSQMPATFNEEGKVEQTTLGALIMTKCGVTKLQTVTKCI